MLMTRARRSLQYEEQARQSWKRIQRAQHRSMACQSIAMLLLVNLSSAQADKHNTLEYCGRQALAVRLHALSRPVFLSGTMAAVQLTCSDHPVKLHS